MSRLTRAHRVRWSALALGWHLPQVLVGLALLPVLVLLAPGMFPLPDVLHHGPVRAPVSVLAALLAALLVLTTAAEPVSVLPGTSAVALYRWRITRMLALTTVAGLGITVPAGAYAASTSLCLLTLVGEGLITTAVLGARYAWFPPAAHLLCAVTLGAQVDRTVAGWAWVVRTDTTPGATLVSLALFVVGLRLWAAHPQPLLRTGEL